MSLLARLFVLVLIAVLPAIGIQAYSVYRLRAERAEEMTAEAQRLLTLVEREQARLYEGVRQLAVAVSEGSYLRTGENQRCQNYLVRLAQRSSEDQVATAVDRDGRVLCSGMPAMLGRSLAGSPILRSTLENGGFALGEWMIWPGNGRPVLPFAVPYPDAHDEVGGIVVVTVDLSRLAADLAAQSMFRNLHLTLADREGRTLVQVPDDGRPSGLPLPAELRPLLRAAEPGVTELTDGSGATRVVAYAPVRDGVHEIFMAISLDRDVAMDQVARTTMQGVAMTLLGLGIAMIAAWIVGTLFIREPVATLTRAAQGWRDGNWSGRTGLADTRSEIDRLGQAFDAMAEALELRERALHGQERHLRAVLDSLPAFVAVLTPAGAALRVNDAALGALGLDADTVVGRPLDQIRCCAHDPAVRARLRRAIDDAAGGLASRFDTVLRLADGRTMAVDVSLTPMFDGEGRVEHLIASGTDITERVHTEETLRLTEERFRTALRNSGVVVFSQDRDLRYIWIANPVGMSAESIIGRTDHDIFDRAEDAKAITAIKRRVLETGEPVREEVRVCVFGQDLVYDLVVDPMRDMAGDIIGVTCAAVDVTARYQAEDAARRAREDAERADEAKSRFLAVASHDLRQPVQSLFLFAAALADRLRGHEAMPLVDNLRQALDAQKSLLDGLLDMSRLESGKITAAPVPLRLEDVFRRLSAEYGPRAQHKGLELRTMHSGLRVSSDPALLDRILRNLIENALKYTRSGRVLLGARRRGDRVSVEVWDTGIGIAGHQLETIFDEFTQVNDTRTERGLGLGLAIVKRLARLLDHRVVVRSTPGRGSVFAIELPLAPGAELVAPAPLPVAAHPAVKGGAASADGPVLVIDDEAIILMGLKATLEGWGYEVLAARSGDQALLLLEKDGRRPRLLLADYQLQHGRTGPEALAAIHDRVGRDVPAIILTGDPSPERRAEANRKGFGILHKPVLAGELRKAIAEAGKCGPYVDAL